MFVATEPLDRGFRWLTPDILALIQGTVHDQQEAQRVLAALKHSTTRSCSSRRQSPLKLSIPLELSTCLLSPPVTLNSPRHTLRSPAHPPAQTKDGLAPTPSSLVHRARALTRRAELSSAIGLLTAEQPLFLPQYMHADVQLLLVQCADSAGNPLIFVNTVRNSHMRDPTLPWSRVCSYATRLTQDGVRPIKVAFAHHVRYRSRYTQAMHKPCTKLLHPRLLVSPPHRRPCHFQHGAPNSASRARHYRDWPASHVGRV